LALLTSARQVWSEPPDGRRALTYTYSARGDGDSIVS